jgi:predicted nuclease with TOPRIM domain
MTDTTANEGGLAARLRRRLDDLRAQFERGRTRLGRLEEETAELRQTLTRIAGAIQVLEEELARHDGGPADVPTRS